MEEINKHREEEVNDAINHDDEEFSDEEDASSDKDESSEEVRRRIERNDHNFVDLDIGTGGYITYDDDWERFGESIGNNT